MKRLKHHGSVWSFALALIAAAQSLTAQKASLKDEFVLPPESVQRIFDKDKNFALLNSMSPDGDHFLIPLRTDLSSLKRMSQKTYQLGMLKITPETNREFDHSTFGVYGLEIYSLKQGRAYPVKIPSDIIISDMTWSLDGRRLAFLAHLSKVSQVWTVDVLSGEAKPLSEAPVMATLPARSQFGRSQTAHSRMLQWTPSGAILTLLVPPNRGGEPGAGASRRGPFVYRTREKPTPTVTLPFLLRGQIDEELFRYYTKSQLALLSPGKPPRMLGEPAMYLEFSLSPDGKHLLAEKFVEPFSHLVGFTNFGRNLEVMDMDGKVLSTIRKVPLREISVGERERTDEDLPREVAWRPDGKGLSLLWVESASKDREADTDTSQRADRLLLLEPPFEMGSVRSLVSTTKRFSQVRYSSDGRYVFATLTRRTRDDKRREDIVAYDLSGVQPQEFVLVKESDPEDILKAPGTILTKSTGNGIPSARLSADGNSVYLEGPGYRSDFKPRPFIDRIAIRSAEKQRVFEGAQEVFERPLAPLDEDLNQIIISRESVSLFPDCFLWKRSDGTATRLTRNQDPFPEITACKRIDFQFRRRDGVLVHARISLPTDYREGTRVPAVFWDYPREYASAQEYERDAIRARNHNAFTHVSYLRWSDIWLSQGYALVHTDIPIIGKGNEYNNNFVPNLVDTVYAAIRKVDEMGYVDVDRIGHGGHSYGAFTTANLLAHTPFFKAGIAGDGAYNRSLTPMTFQRERRLLWDAKTTYLEMSPFFYADRINTPLLLYHFEQDDNSGTFVIQSERLIQALTGLGKNAVLYVYPYDAHSPRCKENYLDLWARWLDWFDTYVKNGKP